MAKSEKSKLRASARGQDCTINWKTIPGFTGNYQVSDTGIVRSMPTDIPMKTKMGEWITRRTKQKTLSLWLDKKGYLYVSIKNKNYAVARLVAKSFVENKHSKPEVNHIDSNPKNNHFSNLEWCTRKENMQHAFKHGNGKAPCLKGSKHPNSKLTENQLLEILKRLADGETSVSIALDYTVSSGRIRSIKHDDNAWRHVR